MFAELGLLLREIFGVSILLSKQRLSTEMRKAALAEKIHWISMVCFSIQWNLN